MVRDVEPAKSLVMVTDPEGAGVKEKDDILGLIAVIEMEVTTVSDLDAVSVTETVGVWVGMVKGLFVNDGNTDGTGFEWLGIKKGVSVYVEYAETEGDSVG